MSFAAASQGIIDVIGETVSVSVNGVETSLTAAFREAWSGENAAGYAVDRQLGELLVMAADWDATGAAEGDSVIRGGVTYRIVDVKPDDAGAYIIQVDPR